MKEHLNLIVWTAVIGAAFFFAWRKGYLLQLNNYFAETQEELKKCTWPSIEELKGSTVLIMVTIALLGAFTVVVDYVIVSLVHTILKL